MARIEVPIRAVIENPPAGVTWALQLSKGDLSNLAAPSPAGPARLVFDFAIQADRAQDGGLRLLQVSAGLSDLAQRLAEHPLCIGGVQGIARQRVRAPGKVGGGGDEFSETGGWARRRHACGSRAA